EKKLNILAERYGEKNLQAYFYFIDDSIKKNENYYMAELNNMSIDYNIPIILCYGKDLFDNIGAPNIWVNMVSNLKEWRNNLPDLPETNFEQNIEESFNEIKDLSPTIFRKILENKDIKREIFPILFPSGKLLEKLSQYFMTKNRPVYKQLSKMCNL
ncbi:MAG: hypothetical protein K6E94_02050, partial [Elusimicrobiaceae bacterium]|nr:hypothetical protein [Elusimicrobiaceae bacterium]